MRTFIVELDLQAYRAPRRRAGGWRIAFTLFLLFAFTAQAYLTQTHIHDLTQRDLTAAVSGAIGQHPLNNGKYPGVPDEKNCPLCRLAAHTGALVVPIIELVLPVTFVLLPAFYMPAPVATARPLSSHWQSRAPPR